MCLPPPVKPSRLGVCDVRRAARGPGGPQQCSALVIASKLRSMAWIMADHASWGRAMRQPRQRTGAIRAPAAPTFTSASGTRRGDSPRYENPRGLSTISTVLACEAGQTLVTMPLALPEAAHELRRAQRVVISRGKSNPAKLTEWALSEVAQRAETKRGTAPRRECGKPVQVSHHHHAFVYSNTIQCSVSQRIWFTRVSFGQCWTGRKRRIACECSCFLWRRWLSWPLRHPAWPMGSKA